MGNFLVFPDRKVILEIQESRPALPENKMRLPDKALGVLIWLAKHPGRVCAREEILDAVWGEDREAYDRVLDNAIRDVRRVLGDSAREPQYVETIPKKGYRLIAAVERLSESPAPPLFPLPVTEILSTTDPERVGDPKSVDENADRSLSRRLYSFYGLLVALLLILIVSTYRWLSSPVEVLTVSVGKFDMSPGDLTFNLEDRVIERLGATTACSGTVFYRFHRLRVLAGTRLVGRMENHGDWLTLDASLKDLPSSASSLKFPQIEGPSNAGPEPLIEELVQRVHHQIDQEICDNKETLDPKRACHCFQAGRHFRGERRYHKAIQYLERTLIADQEHLEALDSLANVYQITGSDEEARKLLLEGLERAKVMGGTKERLIFERRLAQVDEDYESQERLLNELRALEPEEPLWSLALGWFLQTHKRKCSSSLELYRDAIAGAPSRASYYAYLGEAELACGDPKAGAKAFKTYVELEPLSPDAWDGLAMAQQRNGQRAEAGKTLRLAWKLDSSYGPSYLQRGYLYLSQGNFHEAAKQFESYGGTGWPSARANAEIGLARIALRSEQHSLAELHVGRALVHQADAVEALWIQGLLEVKKGRVQAAQKLIDAIRDLRERRSTLWQMEFVYHLEGEIHLAEGWPEKGIQSFYRAVELHPADPSFFRLALARAFLAAGSSDKAMELYEQVLASDPQHPDALCAMGRLKLASGDELGARDAFRRMDEVWDSDTPDPQAQSCWKDLVTLELQP